MKITRGSVSTDRILSKPTIPQIVAWYDDMKLAIERSGYQAYLTGRSLTDITDTYDVDIVFTGTLKIDELEQLLTTSVVTGFRHNLFIDARWQSNIETVEYKNKKITILPTEFIFLNYYEQDYGNGYKIINDYTLNPAYTKVNDKLVKSTFDRDQRLKTHAVEYIIKNGKLASLLLNDFNKETQ